MTGLTFTSSALLELGRSRLQPEDITVAIFCVALVVGGYLISRPQQRGILEGLPSFPFDSLVCQGCRSEEWTRCNPSPDGKRIENCNLCNPELKPGPGDPE